MLSAIDEGLGPGATDRWSLLDNIWRILRIVL